MPVFDAVLLQKIAVFVGALLSTVLVAWVLIKLLDKWVRHAVRKSRSGLDDTLLNALKGPLVFLVLLMGLYWALRRGDFIINPDNPVLASIFFVLFSLLAFWAALRVITGLLDWYTEEVAHITETSFDDHVLPFFRRITIIFLIVILAIVLLAHFNVNVSALVTTLGIGTLAVALAAQEVFGNMISGFIILIDRPFRIGDRVEIEELDTWGDVQDITLHSTRILTRDHRMVSIPNALIGKNRVVNHSIPSTTYRVQTHVSVAYGSDIDHVREVLIAAIRAEDWVMQEERVEALFLEFQDSGLLFRVRCWIEHFVETRRVIDKMNSAIYKALAEAGIEIPFPQRVVHLYQGQMVVETEKKDFR